MRGKISLQVRPAFLTISTVLLLSIPWPLLGLTQELAPTEPEWLLRMEEEGWRKVREGVLERQSAEVGVETFTYGKEGRLFRVRQLRERINALKLERSSHPSRELDAIVVTLESQLSRTEVSPGGEFSNSELASGCEPILSGQTVAGPLSGAGAPGVTASSSASYSSPCGDPGDTYAYAYTRATAGSTMNVRSQEDARNNGASLTSTATASSSGTLDCFSEAVAMALSADPNGPSYGVQQTNYSCSAPVALTIESPSPGATVGSPFRVTATENTADSTGLIRLLLDGQSVVDDFRVESVSWDLAAKPGPHTLTAQLWYLDGTSTSAEVSFTVSNPAVTVATPVAGALYSTPIRVLAHENTGRTPTYMQHWLDGVGGQTLSGTDVYDVWLEIEPGTHQLMVRSYYSDNTYETATLDFNVRVGKVTVTSPAYGATVSSPVRVLAHEDSTRSASGMKVNLDGQDVYSVENSETVDTYINVPSGTHWIHVTAWYSDTMVSRSVMVTVP